MMRKDILLGYALLTSAMQLEARQFEIVFDVNVSERQIGSLEPYDGTNYYLYPSPSLNAPVPVWQPDANFTTPITFQLKIGFSDTEYSYREYESFTDMNNNSIYEKAASIKKIEKHNSPIDDFLNAIIPSKEDFINFNQSGDNEILGELLVRQQTPNNNRYVNFSKWQSQNKYGELINEPNHNLSKSFGIQYGEEPNAEPYPGYDSGLTYGTGHRKLLPNENPPLSSIDSIDGLITLLTSLKDENREFNFWQQWEEENLYVESPFGNCENSISSKNDCFQYFYYNGIQYLGSATITSITEVSEVAVPAAAWLMGSGLLGLSALARHKK